MPLCFAALQECDQVHIDDVSSDDNGQDLRYGTLITIVLKRWLSRALPFPRSATTTSARTDSTRPPPMPACASPPECAAASIGCGSWRSGTAQSRRSTTDTATASEVRLGLTALGARLSNNAALFAVRSRLTPAGQARAVDAAARGNRGAHRQLADTGDQVLGTHQFQVSWPLSCATQSISGCDVCGAVPAQFKRILVK